MPAPPEKPPEKPAGFVPFLRPKSPWEPMVRDRREEPHRGSGATALLRGKDGDRAERPEPRAESRAEGKPDPKADPKLDVKADPKLQQQRLEAELAQLKQQEAARAKEHAEAVAQLKKQQAEAEAQRERAAALCQELEESRRKMLAQFRDGAGRLMLEGARRIAGSALRQQPELLEHMVIEAAEALGKAGLVLYASPQDAEYLRRKLKDTPIRIESDARIQGGMRAESPAGRVDATMETALQAISGVIDQWKNSRD